MKVLKKFLKLFISPFFVGFLVTMMITWSAFKYYFKSDSDRSSTFYSFVSQMHEKTIDWRLKDRGAKPGHDQVAILTIDEQSLREEGHWPWPRDKLGNLIARTVEAGAKVIAFDIIWPESDSNSAIPTISRIENRLQSTKPLTNDLQDFFTREISNADTDKVLGQVIKKNADHLVLGAFFDKVDDFHPQRFQDLCVDVNYLRSEEYRYWKNEDRPITVTDQTLAGTKGTVSFVQLPEAMRDQLKAYLLQLEAGKITEWLKAHSEASAKLQAAAQELGAPLDEAVLPSVLALWLTRDTETVSEILKEQYKTFVENKGVARLFDKWQETITKKDLARLHDLAFTASINYCQRFLGSHDELLHEAEFKKLWGEQMNFADVSWPTLWAGLQKADEKYAKIKWEDALYALRSSSLKNPVEHADRWLTNIPALAAGTKNTGYFNADQDSDGTVRRSFLIARDGNQYSPSLALKAFLVGNDYYAQGVLSEEEVGANEVEAKIVSAMKISDSNGDPLMTIPVDFAGKLPINYSGPEKIFPHVSAAEILSDKEKITVHKCVFKADSPNCHEEDLTVNRKEFLKDKFLFFGATATGIYDLRVTPFQENYPGVETHASLLSNFLAERDRALKAKIDPEVPGFLRTHPAEKQYMVIFLFVLGLALSWLIAHFGSISGLLITAVTLGCVYLVDKIWFFKAGIVITVLFPGLLITALYMTLTFYKYFSEERKKRELKGTFEKYVSPAIVAEVLADPSNIELGGRKMELTVFFSDVRGFTTISEKLDPKALSDLLNSYLTPMTDLVFANKGTLDKYMGDAVMAFFGAPIAYADHAKHACRCALQSIEKLKELQAMYRAKGWPEIDIGIGLNTGEVSVGNMGSQTVRNYTVMGDSVNLGSRLEGINKEYGTRIIISEFTKKAIGDKDFVTREVDWVKVKGKHLPVRIFELIAEGSVPENVAERLKWFNEGFGLYHAKDFKKAVEAFQKALEIDKEDYCSELYVERCQDYVNEPPPDDWDGVFTMKTK